MNQVFIPLHLCLDEGKCKLTFFNVNEIMYFFSDDGFVGKTCVVTIHNARFYALEDTDYIRELIRRWS